jgi:tRNA (guanine-N7-)-methyltransferase
MSRRILSRQIRLRPLDAAALSKYLAHYDSRSLYYEPERFPMLCSQRLFENDAPLELEVGCGTAEFLCALAAREPATNFVGVDVASRPLHKAVEIASSLKLENVRFLHANFSLLSPLLVPCSLRQVYVHFPDPNTRPKFQQRRLVTPAFLDAIHLALLPAGTLSLMTDHAEFFHQLLTLIEADGRFEKTHDERYLIGFEPEVKSRFQKIWERHGLTILHLEVRKRPAAPDGG